MDSFFILYSMLAVFGVGVTIIDLFGILDQATPSGNGEADGGETADLLDDGVAVVHDDATDTEVQHGDQGSWVVSGQSGSRTEIRTSARSEQGRGTLVVAKTIGVLRTGVYFSLGAGPTGLFALLTGVRGTSSLVWSAGAGIFIAVLAKALRAFVRKDLDSSIKPEEFLMDNAVICVPVLPGALGKAIVSRYGRDTELYVRCKDQSQVLTKGQAVQIVDIDDNCYWVEAQV